MGATPRSVKAAGEGAVAEMKPECFPQNCSFLQKLFQKLHRIKRNLDYRVFLLQVWKKLVHLPARAVPAALHAAAGPLWTRWEFPLISFPQLKVVTVVF